MYRFTKNSISISSVSRKINIPVYEFAVAGEPLDDLPVRKVGERAVNPYQHRAHYVCFIVQGNSMDDGSGAEYVIPNGAAVVISQQEVEEARIGLLYLWQLPGTSPCIKELQIISGRLYLVSYNPDPKYSPFPLPEGAKPAARVIGVLDDYGNIDYR